MTDPPRSPYLRLSVGLLLVVTAFRLWFSTRLELVGDEAYYWLWSRHPDYCYLDKGPVIAWAISAGTALFGQTVFGVRFFAVLAATGTGAGLFLLARRLFSDRVGFWALVLAAVVPLFAVGATLMTIDTLYVFFWTWAALTFWHAKDTTRLGPWALTGILVGLGTLSKYTAAAELLCFALFCAWHAPSRPHLRRRTFAVMVGIVLLCLVPVVVWNRRHGWPTTAWLLHRGNLDERAHFRPLDALAFLGQQAGVVSPLLFVGLLAAAFWPSLSRTPRAQTGFVLALFLPLFVFYVLLSFQHAGQANWAAAAYVGGLVLLAARWDEPAHRRPWAKRLAVAALAVAAVESAALHDTRWLHLPRGKDPLDRARGSRDLAAAVAGLQAETGARTVLADKYQTAALLSFYLPGQPQTFLPVASAPFNQFILWPTYRQARPADDVLLVCDRARVSSSLREDFSRIELVRAVDSREAGRTVNHFYVYLCRRASADPPGQSVVSAP